PEEEPFLGRKRSEKGGEQLAEPHRVAGELLLLDADSNLAVDRDLEQLLLTQPSPLLTPREHRREPHGFVRRDSEPVFGPEPREGFVGGESVANHQPLQQDAPLSTAEGSRGSPPLAPEMSAVIPQQVDQHDGQEGGEGAPAFPSAEDSIVAVDQLEESPGAELFGIGFRQAAAPAQLVELALDEVELGFQERPAADCWIGAGWSRRGGSKISGHVRSPCGRTSAGLGHRAVCHDRTVAGLHRQSPEGVLVPFCESSEMVAMTGWTLPLRVIL